MKELITVAASFVIVVALALYMYVGNKEHTIAAQEGRAIMTLIEKNNEELRSEISKLREHIDSTDRIFHNKKTE